jgi:hypothetical protein
MSGVPSDIKLYNKIKKEVWKRMPINSAYRSGQLVKEYRKAYLEKYGNKKAYIKEKPKNTGLKRWFREKWTNQRGKEGYKYKSDIYRPSIRITDKTPIIWKQLTKEEIKRAREEKYKKGRVSRFSKKV